MTQGVTIKDPAAESAAPAKATADDETLSALVFTSSRAAHANLVRVLTPAGISVIPTRTLSHRGVEAQAEPYNLLITESRALKQNAASLLSQFAKQRPLVRRVVLADPSDVPALAEAVNEGLVHRLLLRPISDGMIVEALRGQAQRQRLASRTSELKALAAKKSRELDLAQRLLRLQRLAAVGTLAAGLAHEINNPLGSILAFAQILIREGRLCEEDLEALRYIEQGAVRCKRVIDAVVSFAHMANAPEANEPVNLGEVAQETVGLMRKQIEAAGAEAEVEVADSELSVRGTLQGLMQLTQALIANAAEATQGPDGIEPIQRGHIDVRVFSRGDRACIAVRDNGRGIAAEDRDRIFEPFYTTKTEGEAIGLGLTTADRIAHSHGGLIEVDSEPRRGSTFTLVLPKLEQEQVTA